MHFHFRSIWRVVSLILTISGATLVFPILCAFYYQETQLVPALVTSLVVSLAIGIPGYFYTGGKKHPFIHLYGDSSQRLRSRDCYLLMLLLWVVSSLVGALPYFLSGEVSTYIDAFFESVAGFTTTGAGVVDTTALPHCLLLWKAITHWLGGMGILIFMSALLPIIGFGGQKIAAMAALGPDLTKIAPRSTDAARLMYFIYSLFTVSAFILLSLSPQMDCFEALINTMGCVSTAGLLTHPEGILAYNSLYIEGVLELFMILSSLNFLLYILLLRRDFSSIRRNAELKVFAGLLLGSTGLCTLSLYLAHTYGSLALCLRHAFFQVVSFLSTCGYVIDDFSFWPPFCLLVFIVLVIIGGCGSSTSGGIKIIRFMVMVKITLRSLKKRMHPRSVFPTKVGGQHISLQAITAIASYVILYFFTFLVGTLLISLDCGSLEEAFSVVFSLLSTSGVYLSETGASALFAGFSQPTLVFMSFLMIVGRLELFTVYLLFFPSFWSTNRG